MAGENRLNVDTVILPLIFPEWVGRVSAVESSVPTGWLSSIDDIHRRQVSTTGDSEVTVRGYITRLWYQTLVAASSGAAHKAAGL